jgi:competence protein ComGE
MLRKCEGYFLAEMLLSLAAFIMAASVLLPIAIHVLNQNIELRKEADAGNLLFDELMHIKISGTESGRVSIQQNSITYRVTIDKNEDPSAWEVCIHYEGEQQQNYKKCGFTE